MTDDHLLIQQLQDPDTRRRAFETVVRQYGEQLYWQIRRMVLGHDDANDVLQNTFLKAWNAISGFHGDSKLYTWLSRIAINESIDFIRRQHNTVDIDADDDHSIGSTLTADSYFDGDRAQLLLQKAIAALPDVQRAVFQMKYFDEMKYSEMSEILGTSEGALKASYHIAVKKIADYLRDND